MSGCCDDEEAQISGEHEEEGEQSVSLLSLEMFLLSQTAGIMAKKTTAVSSFSAADGSFFLCCAIPLLLTTHLHLV